MHNLNQARRISPIFSVCLLDNRCRGVSAATQPGQEHLRSARVCLVSSCKLQLTIFCVLSPVRQKNVLVLKHFIASPQQNVTSFPSVPFVGRHRIPTAECDAVAKCDLRNDNFVFPRD